MNQLTKLDKLIKIENVQFFVNKNQTKKGQLREITLDATIIGFKQSSVALNENKNPVGGKK